MGSAPGATLNCDCNDLYKWGVPQAFRLKCQFFFYLYLFGDIKSKACPNSFHSDDLDGQIQSRPFVIK